MKKIRTSDGFMKVKSVVADVLSYPKRTLHDALRASHDRATSVIKTNREIKKSRIKSNSYPY